nr:hypothetical protein CFP56_08744 [Quercus suber]
MKPESKKLCNFHRDSPGVNSSICKLRRNYGYVDLRVLLDPNYVEEKAHSDSDSDSEDEDASSSYIANNKDKAASAYDFSELSKAMYLSVINDGASSSSSSSSSSSDANNVGAANKDNGTTASTFNFSKLSEAMHDIQEKERQEALARLRLFRPPMLRSNAHPIPPQTMQLHLLKQKHSQEDATH